MCLQKIFAILLLGFATDTIFFQGTNCERLNLCDRAELAESNITEYRYKNVTFQNCGCNRVKCIRKCCADGFYVTRGFCKHYENSSHDFQVPVHNGRTFVRNVSVKDNGFIAGTMSCRLFPFTPSKHPLLDRFLVQEDGSIWTYLYGFVDNDRYCVDYLDGFEGLSALVCEISEGIEMFRRFNVIGMIISMPFLFITFVAYALLPDRNLHMKALMIYVMNLLLGYIFLVVLQLSNGTIETSACKAFGYLCIFLLMSSFLWMNVICIDIWFAFSGLRGFSGTKRAENKRFLIYNAYAWGTATLITLIVVIMNEMNTGAAWYVPGIAQGQCFLALGYPELLYFYGPMAIIITINVILFAMTAFKIRAVKKETSMLKKDDSKRHSYENDKQKFNLYLKLLFAMGVNWSLEIISWAVAWKVAEAPKYIWYLTDFCNAIYGVFIFFIFVFKRSIWKLLKKRYYSFRGQTNLAHSMTTNPTRTTSYSTTSTAARDSQPGGSHTSTLLTTTTET